MYKYIKSYNYGFEEGIKSARYDYFKRKAKYKKVIKNSVSIMYDIGYIEGYNKMLYSLKNNISIFNKI